MNDDTQIDELINDLYLRLQEVSKSDFYYLKRRFNRLKKAKASTGNQWCKLEKEVDVSIDKLQLRKQNIPSCNFDPQLPVNQRTDEIIMAIEQEQVLILCGETGSGKTTQLPKLCLQAGRGIHGLIGHTQPRRIAAKSVAKRIADELGSDPGSFVGYKIRHHDKTDSNNTYIKLMTDGILLAEMQQDKYLNQYDTLIIDEAHERSLNIDFILGYLKQLLPKRPDLKVIITSATIDVERFSAHFNNASIIEVSGRNWPVDISYLPIDESDDENEVEEREEYILQAIKDLGSIDTGDILIFMEGEGEIHETDKFLRKQKLANTEILPLYARLSSSRQNKIFAPHKKRHIVLATNVAETSLTIPGIRYVIDTGMARVSRYSYRNKIQRLPTEKISRAAANQRKGRCGRTSDGICIRLYSEEDFLSRSEFTQPEILRTNLASVILKMKALKLGDIIDFPFIDPPDKKFINDGIRVLKEINALDVEGKLTPIGKKISRIPVDPRYARILLAGHDFNCLNEILIIISALSIQDPRERPVDKTKKADEAHNKFNDDASDFVWFVNLWSFYHVQMKKLSQNKLRKLCQQNFISYVRMLEWLDLHRQLRHICTELELIINSEPADYKNIHCAILTGMPSHVAQLTGKHEYTGARNIKLNIFPGSGQFENNPKWFVAADLVETSRLFARTVARIEPQWLINTAKHLLNFTYSEPEWDSKNARVIAYERISLYGLILSANKKVNYGKIKFNEARAIFVRCGLIDGDFGNSIEFYKHNNQLVKDIRKLEIKSRRPDILDEEVIFDFYMNKLPDDVYDGQSFSQWTKKLKNNQTKHLFLSKEEIMRHDAEDVSDTRFPDSIQQHDIS
ncbi:MAG: ATP-dependent RNA helicase HrpA, partial [Proteobacteria bacterium]|nr:ATP-dependent RNA helicase HrpA [Pseudomonadota bacterium]